MSKTIKELKEALDEVGVAYPSGAKLKDLQKIYDENVEEVVEEEAEDEKIVEEAPKKGKGKDKVEDKDYLRKFQYKKVNDVPTVGGILTDPEKGGKAEAMKAHLLSQPKVRIIIQKKQGEEGNTPLSVNLNGYRLDLPKNEYLDLPEQIAQLIMDSQQQRTEAIGESRVDGDAGKEKALI